MTQSAIVLGAGMVGVSVALHLRRRGYEVMLVDRRGPGEGASFGNGGLIQREAVYPHPFRARLPSCGGSPATGRPTSITTRSRCPASSPRCCATGGIRNRRGTCRRCRPMQG
ncbi:FAD-dependent oxidoreductase [Dankookia sp. P2]|uniref:FAD-dependent oxidoreductase n=1 Tax=Dankookia sp. P2 TaxID=3423955 RepID=UPI003D663D27